MLSVSWDIEGVVHWELLDAGTTLTAAIYSQQLEKVAVALRQKRPQKSKVILQMDNTRPHVANPLAPRSTTWVGRFYPILHTAGTLPLPTIICSGPSTTRLEGNNSIPTAHSKPG